MKIILGSGSKGRRDVLEKAGYVFDVITADIDEKSILQEDPKVLVLALAHAKADAILPEIKEPAILITADQVVVCDGIIRGKPRDVSEAKEFIRCYATHPMETVSSIVVVDTQTGKRAEGVDVAKVYFKPIPEEVVSEAIAIGRILHCAGAMRCEDQPFNAYVERFEGTEDSTSGMPLKLLKQLFEKIKK
ncbi:MAG: Maf family protein [Patescibacteria group bacterium]